LLKKHPTRQKNAFIGNRVTFLHPNFLICTGEILQLFQNFRSYYFSFRQSYGYLNISNRIFNLVDFVWSGIFEPRCRYPQGACRSLKVIEFFNPDFPGLESP